MSSVYNINSADGGSSPFSGVVEVANGGTGATTLTGVLIGTGTTPFTTKANPAGAFVGDSDAQTLTNKSLVDATTEIVDEVDATKKITFQCAGNSPGTTLELQTNQTTSQGLSIPDVSAGDAIVTTGTGQTITGAKLHTGTLTVTDNNFFIRDQLGTTKRLKFEVSAGSNNCTLTIAGRQTSTRQIYIPNLTIDNDYFVTENTTQTMVNKTLTSPIIGGTTNMAALTASQAVVTDAGKNLVSLPYTQLSTPSSIPYRDADGETYFNSVNLLQRSIASATSTTTLNDHDPQLIIVTGTQPHTIRLPAATSYAQVGRIFIITNRGTKSIRIEANTGGTIRSVVASACSISVVCNSVGFDGSNAWTIFNDTQYAGRLQTTGNAVETQDASPPSVNQVLTATSATTATWQTPGYLGLTANRAVITDGSSNLSTLQYTNLPTSSTLVSRNANNEVFFNSAGKASTYILSATGTTILAVGATEVQIVYGTNTQTIRLPVTTTFSAVGTIYTIANTSTQSIAINASDSTAVLSSLTPGCSASVICNNIASSTNSSWYVFNNTQITGQIQTSTGTPVVVNTAAPPSTDMVLTAANATSGLWKYPGYFVDNIQTTNNTPVGFGDVAVFPSGTVANIKAYLVGKNSTASTCLGYEMFCVAQNNGGVVSIVGGSTVTAKETNAAADATFIVSGTSIQVQVTGIAATTIDWRVRVHGMVY